MTHPDHLHPDPRGGKPERAHRMALFARATSDELKQALDALPEAATAQAVRGPETGLIMLRGRIGGGGNAFNLGEATVTRATVRLANGAIGHGQRLGTDREAARLAAIADALGEAGGHEAAITALLQTVGDRLCREETLLAQETAATRVDFFTLVRGEDQ